MYRDVPCGTTGLDERPNYLVQLFFDLDGPLLDVRQKYYTIYSDLLGRQKCSLLDQAAYWEFKRARVPEEQIARKTVPESLIGRYVDERRSVIEEIRYLRYDRVWPGVPEFLAVLGRAHQLVIVTMRNSRHNLLQQLGWLGLAPLFDKVLSRNANEGDWTVKHGLMEGEIRDPSRAMIIGDTEADIEAGRRLGIRTCAVTCGIRNERLVVAMRADFVVENTVQMKALVS